MKPSIFSSLGPLISKLKKHLRYALLILALAVLSCGAMAAWIFWDLPDTTSLRNRSLTMTIEVPDWQGEMHSFAVGPKNPYWAPLDAIPDEMKWAVIVAEDANFYEHSGIDVPALKEAIKYDLKRKRLALGASTITQQLAKNLYLSRDKSFRRKLREMVLAQRLEANLTKGRILELYLNVVELGPLVYGVGHGSRYYFDKSVSQLTPAEAAFLAAILPGPRIAFNPETKAAKVRQRAARLLKLLGLRNILSEAEINDALIELDQLGGQQAPPSFPPAEL
ncbi:MAG: transglycosylase domain-containing protein [Desulfuromonadales bacterium]